ncbi:MAG TPA: photosynthetic reaction center cytochrome c subunit family protein [Candidatus Solibacter sp.]|nr:photosynthetic reaction center cytochrome c subunit family protein [Candidatus Solibacter sp.]
MRYLATAMLLAALALSAQDAPKGDAPKKGGGQPPRNLKGLKPEEVRPSMGGMRGALGQNCDFCRVQDRASDENPKKLTARKMMEMTNHINSMLPSDAKVKVTCYTCHRGVASPLSAPPPAQ